MLKFIVLALLVGIVIGFLAHKRIVKEELLLADKVKVLLGAKLKDEIKAAREAVTDQFKKLEGK